MNLINKKASLGLLVLVAVALTNVAMAGADNTFSAAVTEITNWLSGSMGQLFAIGALAVGLGMGIVNQSIIAVVTGVGIALAVTTGPTALTSIISMTV